MIVYTHNRSMRMPKKIRKLFKEKQPRASYDAPFRPGDNASYYSRDNALYSNVIKKNNNNYYIANAVLNNKDNKKHNWLYSK